MQKIILSLDSPASHEAAWTVVDDSGIVQQTVTKGQLASLTTIAPDVEFIVIVPAEDIFLTTTIMPKMTRQRLMQALPYQLEDHLLGDVTDLFFATGPFHANQPLPVAIIAKQKIQAWLDLLAQYSIIPRAFIPASLLAPIAENTWSVLVVHDRIMVRTGQYAGFACERINFPVLLEAQLAALEQRPEAIEIRNYTTQLIAPHFDDILISEKSFPFIQFLEDVALWSRSPVLNLLQGPYQPKRKVTYNKKIWVRAGMAFFAWIALAVFSKIISFFILHHQTSQLEASIDAIYKRNFPNATAIIAPKQRMEDKLSELSSQTGHNPMLLWLGVIGNAMKSTSGIHLKQMDYHDEQLNIEFSAESVAQLDSFSQALKSQGLNVKQQNTTVNPKNVTGSLLISGGAKS